MRRGAAHRAHFIELDLHSATRQLARGFRSRETCADNFYSVHSPFLMIVIPSSHAEKRASEGPDDAFAAAAAITRSSVPQAQTSSYLKCTCTVRITRSLSRAPFGSPVRDDSHPFKDGIQNDTRSTASGLI